MGTLLLTWLLRYGHVVSAAIWLGGYALLVLVLLPRLAREPNELYQTVLMAVVRLLTYAGTATILFGIFLITRTRGFNIILRGGEWGGIVLSCLVIAIILLGIGDGALRPALKPSADAKALRRAQRWAWLGFWLSILAAGLMTRTIYAIS